MSSITSEWAVCRFPSWSVDTWRSSGTSLRISGPGGPVEPFSGMAGAWRLVSGAGGRVETGWDANVLRGFIFWCCLSLLYIYIINMYKLTWSVRCYIHIDNTAWGVGSSFLLWPTERQSLPSNHSTRKKFRVDIEFVHVGFHMWGWRLGLLRWLL